MYKNCGTLWKCVGVFVDCCLCACSDIQLVLCAQDVVGIISWLSEHQLSSGNQYIESVEVGEKVRAKMDLRGGDFFPQFPVGRRPSLAAGRTEQNDGRAPYADAGIQRMFPLMGRLRELENRGAEQNEKKKKGGGKDAVKAKQDMKEAGKEDRELEQDKKEGDREVIKAKKAMKAAEEVVRDTNSKAYKRVSKHKECLKRMEALSHVWYLCTRGTTIIQEDVCSMESVSDVVAKWKHPHFREGFSVVSDVSVNLVDYLVRKKKGIFEYELLEDRSPHQNIDGRFITLPTQILMSK